MNSLRSANSEGKRRIVKSTFGELKFIITQTTWCVKTKKEREREKERDGEMCAGPFGENLMPFFVYYHFHVRSVNLFKFELPPLSLLPPTRRCLHQPAFIINYKLSSRVFKLVFKIITFLYFLFLPFSFFGGSRENFVFLGSTQKFSCNFFLFRLFYLLIRF